MPLRDHFRPPLDNHRYWEGLHAGWPVMIVANVQRKLPLHFFAEPRVQVRGSREIDVDWFEGSVPALQWTPSRPSLTVATELPVQDAYRVCVYDKKSRPRLVAVVEIISPNMKDRPDQRQAFISRWSTFLQDRVSVVVVDVVTTRTPNLYAELLEQLGVSDPTLPTDTSLYTAACRMTKQKDEWLLETWSHALHLGQPLPTMPLWLADNLVLPLELEDSYEQSCYILNIP